MTQQLLQQLVEMRGIETQYVDAWGKPATIAESSKAKLLNTLGYDTSSDEKNSVTNYTRYKVGMVVAVKSCSSGSQYPRN